jgi:predicted Holliday junction resolvase-like endonuclease
VTIAFVIAVAAAAIFLVLWLATRIAARQYRATHPYTTADVDEARKHSVATSRGVLRGHATEQLAPLLPTFTQHFDAGDARFIGKPIDYVIFDGCGDGVIRRVVLLEVKTGAGRLTPIQRQVEAAVAEGRVEFAVLDADGLRPRRTRRPK